MLADSRVLIISKRLLGAVFFFVAVIWFATWIHPSEVFHSASSTGKISTTSTSKTSTTVHDTPLNTPSHETSPNVLQSAGDPVREAIKTLFDSIKLDPIDRSYRDANGLFFTGAYGSESIWKKPLGKKVLILDVDTRLPSNENEILNKEKKVNWEKLSPHGTGGISHAITSHYLYALMHGYDYKYIQAVRTPGLHDTWIKPRLIKQMLPDYQFVICLDADAVISHLEIPLEWMFNRWGILEHTSIAMPHDTEEIINGQANTRDSKGVLVLNSGFIVTQNNPVTFEMYDAWIECPTEVRYPGCAHWKENWSHEQRAFSEYIRYDYDKAPHTIIGIPCDDAMGYPGFQKQAGPNFAKADCKGQFIRHYTLGKETVHPATAETIMQVLFEVLQKNILLHANETWMTEQEKEKPVELEAEEKQQEETNEQQEEETNRQQEEVRNKQQEEVRHRLEEERIKQQEE